MRQALRNLAAVDAGVLRACVLAGLAEACLPGLLLAILAALGPIVRHRPGLACAPQPGRSGTERQDAGLHADIAAEAAALPSHPPYGGYRTDVVAGHSLSLCLSLVLMSSSGLACSACSLTWS